MLKEVKKLEESRKKEEENYKELIKIKYNNNIKNLKILDEDVVSNKTLIKVETNLKQTFFQDKESSVKKNNEKKTSKQLQRILTLNEIVKNKTVVIVGPAQYTSKFDQADFIESFDIVVRINRSIPVPDKLKSKIGQRTDILISNLNINDYEDEIPLMRNTIEKSGVKLVYCPYPRSFPFPEDQ